MTNKVFPYRDGSLEDPRLLIKFKEGDIKIVEISNTSFSGGIVASGGLYYQNDSLRDAVMNILRSSSRSKRQ